MSTPSTPTPKNSTNVRPFALRALGIGLRGLNLVSREAATRACMELFTRPRGRRGEPRLRAPFSSESRFTLDAGSQRLAAWAWGDGPLVLLLHGWDGRAAQMSSFVEPLVDAGYAVLAVDAPAHGASAGRQTNMLEWSLALRAIARRFLGLAGIVAHSAGCVATAHALRRGLNVERVVFVSPPEAIPEYSRQLIAALGLPATLHDEMWTRWEAKLGIQRGDFSVLAGAAEQRAPLLLLHDRDDREAPFPTSERLAQTWPGARLLATEGLGHSRIRRVQAAVDAATAFIAQADGGTERGRPRIDEALVALER